MSDFKFYSIYQFRSTLLMPRKVLYSFDIRNCVHCGRQPLFAISPILWRNYCDIYKIYTSYQRKYPSVSRSSSQVIWNVSVSICSVFVVWTLSWTKSYMADFVYIFIKPVISPKQVHINSFFYTFKSHHSGRNRKTRIQMYALQLYTDPSMGIRLCGLGGE